MTRDGLKASKSRLYVTSVFIMLATGLSRFLGMIRVVLIAYLFGTSGALDAFWMALIVPTMVAYLLTTGTVNFIPIFSRELVQGGERRAWEFGNPILSFYLVLILVGTVVAFFLSPALVRVISPGFEPEAHRLATQLTYIMMGMALFVALAELATTVLHSYQLFTFPALGGIVNNVFLLISVALLYSRWGIFALATGLVAGAMGQVLIQLPGLLKVVRPYRWQWNLRHPALKRWWHLTYPLYIGKAGAYLNNCIDKIFASTLPQGSVSALSYGFILAELPATTLSLPLLKALFPLMSRQFGQKDPTSGKQTLSESLAAITFVIAPVAVLLLVLGRPLIQILLERGIFGSESTDLTTTATFFYAIGLPAFALNDAFVGAFNATHNNLLPMKIGLIRMGINILLNALFIRILGIGGLALATSLSAYFKLGLLIYFFQRQYGALPWLGPALGGGRPRSGKPASGKPASGKPPSGRPASGRPTMFLGGSLQKIAAAAGFMALILLVVWRAVQSPFEVSNFWGRLLILAGLTILGLGSYLLACSGLKIQEWQILRNWLTKRLSFAQLGRPLSMAAQALVGHALAGRAMAGPPAQRAGDPAAGGGRPWPGRRAGPERASPDRASPQRGGPGRAGGRRKTSG